MSTVYYGTEGNDPNGITIPSDGQGSIKAADVNPALEGTFDKVCALDARVGRVDALNFVYSADIDGETVGAAAWLPRRNMWLVAAKTDTTHFHLRFWAGTYDVVMASLGNFTISSTAAPVGIAAHPTDDAAVAVLNDIGGGPYYYAILYAAGAAAAKMIPTAGGTAIGAGILFFGGKWIAIGKRLAAHEIALSDDGDTWTYLADATAFGAAHDAPLLVAQSPTTCLAFPRNASKSEDGTSAYARSGEYLRSTDGETWTKHGPSWVGPSVTYVGGIYWSGLTYDAKRELFVAVGVGSDGANDMMVWTSPDGLSWTYAGTKVLSARPYGIAAHDGTWIVPVVGVHGSDREVAYSTDAGATWFVVHGGWDFDGGLTGGMIATPISNGHQVLIATDQSCTASLISRRTSFELEEYTP